MCRVILKRPCKCCPLVTGVIAYGGKTISVCTEPKRGEIAAAQCGGTFDGECHTPRQTSVGGCAVSFGLSTDCQRGEGKQEQDLMFHGDKGSDLFERKKHFGRFSSFRFVKFYLNCYLCAHNHEFMKISVVNKSHHDLPRYATAQSAGVDLRANLDAPVTLQPLSRSLIPTGLFIALPPGVEAQVRPRSGLALKHGVTVLNSPGTIDADYRGEICVILVNLSDEPFVINDGERIAQMVIARHEQAEWELTDSLDQTERGSGGFGHTGKE